MILPTVPPHVVPVSVPISLVIGSCLLCGGTDVMPWLRAWALKVWLLVSFPRSADRRIKSQQQPGSSCHGQAWHLSKDIQNEEERVYNIALQ